MKKPGIDGNFILCYGLNLVFNSFWLLPAVVLFIAHFVAGIPLWPAGLAFIAWLLIIFGITLFMSWAVSTGNGNAAGTGTRGKVTIRRSSDRTTRVPDSTNTQPPSEE